MQRCGSHVVLLPHYSQPIRVKITNGSRKDKVVCAVSGMPAQFLEGGGQRLEEREVEGRAEEVKECLT